VNVIGIYSRAFCGTTVSVRLLSCIPGTVAAGETFRLLPPVLRHRHCAACGMGRPCPVFTPGFLAKRFTTYDLYRQLTTQLGLGRTMIVSDKDPRHYEACLGKKQMDVVVLVRNPLAVVRSDLERSVRFKTVEASLKFYCERFGAAEKWCDDWARRHVIVALESLLVHPQDVVSGVAKAFGLGLPEVPEDLSSVRIHALGGNGTAYTSDRLVMSEKWKDALPPGVQETIRKHSAMKLYQRLAAKSVVPL
jgi:hypothetical protein